MAKRHGSEDKPKESKEKLFADQYDDEEVLYLFRKHPIAMRKGLVIASVALLAGPLITLGLTYARPNNPPTMGFFFLSLFLSLLLSAVLFFPSWVSWYYSYFIVTDQRLVQITRRGLFNKTVVDMNLNQIQSMNYQVAGLQATMLGFGTIMVQTYMGDLVIHEVHHPEKVQKKIANILKDKGIVAQVMTVSEGEQQQSNEDV